MLSNFFQENKCVEAPKLPVVPKKLTQDEKQLYLSKLTYLVPGTFTSLGPQMQKLSGKKSKSKLKGKRRGEEVRFPSPAKASSLNKVYHIFQEYSGGAVSSDTTLDQTGAINFTASGNTQNAQLSAVFDQYRIAMVEVTFMPRVNLSTASSTPPVFYSVVDLDDSSSTSISSLSNYPGAKITEAYKQHVHTFVPHVAVAVYSGAFTSFANEVAPWIDVVSDSVQHYGVKWGFTTTSTVYTYDVKIRIHFQFKNVR